MTSLNVPPEREKNKKEAYIFLSDFLKNLIDKTYYIIPNVLNITY